MTDYEKYLLSEWELYQGHPERCHAVLAAVAGRRVSRVLDVGCGAGQELLPFVQGLGATGIGVDISPEAPSVAGRQFARLGCAGQVEFRCCPAESLPFADDSFDVVTCRLALPYTRNAAALSEMARVLRPDGLLILKIHHARFYLRRLRLALSRRQLREAGSLARVLLAGTLYHLTGWQPNCRLLPREVYQTRWMLRRILSSVGLAIREELRDSDSNPRTPVFLIEKGPRLRSKPEPAVKPSASQVSAGV
jgi:ubiquinone/menaquinone biosynthesis C-methylase UbiE